MGRIITGYATGAVTGNEGIGGLAGQNTGEITASYATGPVSGNENVGGLAGRNMDDAGITASYATGRGFGRRQFGRCDWTQCRQRNRRGRGTLRPPASPTGWAGETPLASLARPLPGCRRPRATPEHTGIGSLTWKRGHTGTS